MGFRKYGTRDFETNESSEMKKEGEKFVDIHRTFNQRQRDDIRP